MSYAIEAAVEMPPEYRGRPPSQERLAMLALEVGESFLITDEARVNLVRTLNRKLAPKCFCVRKIAGQGWRVWRVE